MWFDFKVTTFFFFIQSIFKYSTNLMTKYFCLIPSTAEHYQWTLRILFIKRVNYLNSNPDGQTEKCYLSNWTSFVLPFVYDVRVKHGFH